MINKLLYLASAITLIGLVVVGVVIFESQYDLINYDAQDMTYVRVGPIKPRASGYFENIELSSFSRLEDAISHELQKSGRFRIVGRDEEIFETIEFEKRLHALQPDKKNMLQKASNLANGLSENKSKLEELLKEISTNKNSAIPKEEQEDKRARLNTDELEDSTGSEETESKDKYTQKKKSRNSSIKADNIQVNTFVFGDLLSAEWVKKSPQKRKEFITTYAHLKSEYFQRIIQEEEKLKGGDLFTFGDIDTFRVKIYPDEESPGSFSFLVEISGYIKLLNVRTSVIERSIAVRLAKTRRVSKYYELSKARDELFRDFAKQYTSHLIVFAFPLKIVAFSPFSGAKCTAKSAAPISVEPGDQVFYLPYRDWIALESLDELKRFPTFTVGDSTDDRDVIIEECRRNAYVSMRGASDQLSDYKYAEKLKIRKGGVFIPVRYTKFRPTPSSKKFKSPKQEQDNLIW